MIFQLHRKKKKTIVNKHLRNTRNVSTNQVIIDQTCVKETIHAYGTQRFSSADLFSVIT